MPRRRLRELEERQQRQDWLDRNAPVLAKWLWLLFWLVIPRTLAETLTLDVVASAFPAAGTVGEVLGALASLAYGVFLWQLRTVDGRYRTAALCSLAGSAGSAVILFAVAILMGCLVLIPGENVWFWLHQQLLGLFGVCAIFWPILLLYIAVVTALDRHDSKMSMKIVLMAVIIILLCAAVYVFGNQFRDVSFWEELVALCAQAGVEVVSIPGPCALVAALAASGQPTGRFTFEGFLAMNKKNRRRHLESLRGEERTMIFYEAPHKLPATLADLAETFGPDRPVSLCRELTKLHEEIIRTTLGEAAERYQTEPPKGEFVLVVRGAEPREEPEATLEDGLDRVRALREEGLSLRDAVKRAAKELGLSRNELYRLAVED